MRLPDFLLFPFACLYDGVTAFRNHLFETGLKKSQAFDVPTIVVGNLAVGGTGKTPFVEFLIRYLSSSFSLAVLSRGYGRKTKGFILADETVGPEEIGDEPYQMYAKFKKQATVAVGEERILAIPMMLAASEGLQAILLDDAFQHRYLKADWYILLTSYQRPFYEDHLLPLGRLREGRRNASRAGMILVTKCPENMTAQEKNSMTAKIVRYAGKNVPVYFSGLKYGKPYSLRGGEADPNTNLIVVTGIVDPQPMVQELAENHHILKVMSFPDHHCYTERDMQSIRSLCEEYKSKKPAVITTEKDAVKIRDNKLLNVLEDFAVFVLPVALHMGSKDKQEILQKMHEIINLKSSGVYN